MRKVLNNTQKPLAVIILAAGKGTRMNSDLPKVLHPIGDLPMITRVVRTAQALQADRIVPVLGYKHELVQSILKDEPVECALQLEQLGTAHAVLQCGDILKDFSGNVLILYGDVPLVKVETLANLLSLHSEMDIQSTILTTDLPDPTGYGRIIRNHDHSLMKIVEEKDATEEERQVIEINSGIYVFDTHTLFRLLPLVENNNKQNEYYLPDVLNLIIQKKGKVAIDKIKNYVEIQGVNNIQQLDEVNEFYENI